MVKILAVNKGNSALNGGFEGHSPSLKKITPPEALRRVERGAISTSIIAKKRILSRAF